MARKTKKLAIVTGSLLVVCFVAGQALAFGPHHNGPGKGWGPGHYGDGPGQFDGGPGFHQGFHPGFERFLVDEGVPAATVTAFFNDKDKFRNDNAEAMKAMRAKGLELYEEMSKPQPDANRAKALQGELSQLRTQMDAKRIDNMLYMKKTYPQICDIMQQKFKDRDFGPGFGPGPGGKGKPGPGPDKFGPGPR